MYGGSLSCSIVTLSPSSSAPVTICTRTGEISATNGQGTCREISSNSHGMRCMRPPKRPTPSLHRRASHPRPHVMPFSAAAIAHGDTHPPARHHPASGSLHCGLQTIRSTLRPRHAMAQAGRKRAGALRSLFAPYLALAWDYYSRETWTTAAGSM